MAEITPGAKRLILARAEAAADKCAGNEPRGADARECEADIQNAKQLSVKLNYEPFPKQRQFHASPAKYRLFGGAAGPGKTKALLMEAVLQAIDHPNVNTLLLRRTFPELEASLLHYF